jgi:cobalt/nickel transport protein
MALWQRNLLLLLGAVALAVAPLLFLQGAEWSGTDTLGMEAISSLQPGFEPWAESVFSPGAYERYVFGLQALLGMLVLAGGLGWLVGRHRARTGGGREPVIAAVVATAAVLLAVALLFVQTEFGELQGFICGVQGVGLGTLAFFPGYTVGRRRGDRYGRLGGCT